MAQTDIIVLGATGFTGRLIAAYLSTHPQRSSFTFSVGGRSKAKLAALSLDASVRRVVVDVTRPGEVEEAVRDVKVVINTVGPFWTWGTPVVRACLRNGVHYVDLTGETPWILDIIRECDYAATKTRSVIIPSCGMDSIPSDLLVFLSARTLKARLGPSAAITRSTTAFRLSGGISGGTLSTMMTALEDVPRKQLRASALDWSLSPVIGVPGAHPQLTYTLPHVYPPVRGAFFFMSKPNTAIVQRTWGMHELAQHRTSTETVRAQAKERAYGKEFVYREFLAVPNVFVAALISIGFFVGAMCLAQFKAARWLFKQFAIQSGEGPSKETLEGGFLEATNVSTTGSVHAKSVLRGHGDPGYALTAIMISESALSLVLEASALPALASEGGVLTPMSALGEVLVRRLEASGKFEFESGIIGEQEVEGKKSR